MKKFIFIFMLFVLLSNSKSAAQEDASCAYGSCLGMIAGGEFTGGYGIQFFNPEGLNHYIDIYNSDHPLLVQHMDHFSSAKGFIVGLTLMNEVSGKTILAFKLNYKWVDQKNDANTGQGVGAEKREYDLSLGQFGMGLSVSYYLSKRLDLNILEGYMTFNNAKLKNSYFNGSIWDKEETLKNTDLNLGFNLSTGLTFYFIPPYLSVSGTLGYSYFKIDHIAFDSGSYLSADENTSASMDNFISGGGFYAFASLNFRLPF